MAKRKLRKRWNWKPKIRIEFTKTIVFLVTVTYFIGVFEGRDIVRQHPEMLGDYLRFIRDATIVTIGFYVWKAKHENINKHKWNPRDVPESGQAYGGYDDYYGGGGTVG